ncbi:MAG: undecaprenyl-diphosphate phosphatase [Acidimicrobiia bacterium]|nr:undecaprenyl-diphosphate phosphatase [Acidimicrobiia bacterium]MYJ15504.1 undecaprenyl-diphosphate phosphatase [Acidimicrobiia bacterium]
MINAVTWGIIQGLTEFLPVSSSGHLVLVPALLSKMGPSVSTPSLAQSAFLHLGTLAAVVLFYRRDIGTLLKFRGSAGARRLWGLLMVGTAPAALGLLVEDLVESAQDNTAAVSVALGFTTVVLLLGHKLGGRTGQMEKARLRDGLWVGLAQVLAFMPGVSRSAVTITAGMARGLSPEEATRYSFLLAVPAIAAAGVRSVTRMDLAPESLGTDLVGLGVAAVVGYFSIVGLLSVMRRIGLAPFATYTAALAVAGFYIL